MTGFVRMVVALAVSAPLLAGNALAFSTVTVGGTNPDGSPRFVDPGDASKQGTGDEGRAWGSTWRHTEGSVTFGAQFQSSDKPSIGGYDRTPLSGAGADFLFQGRR